MPNLTDIDPLDHLTMREGGDIRLPLLHSLTDLYLQKPFHTVEEEQHFTELALRLLDQADTATRMAIAQRLIAYPAAPIAIMHRLAADEPAVAGIIAELEPEPPAPMSRNLSDVELCELFFAASADERRLILVNLPFAPTVAGEAAIVASPDAQRQLETAALGRNPDAFMRELEQGLGISPALAYRIVRDPFGEPIIVAAKVLGIAPDVLQRILLFLNPAIARSVQLVYELSALFDQIEVGAAQALVAVWRAAAPRPAQPPSFRPLHDDRAEARPRRAAGASPATPSRDSNRLAIATAGSRR